MLKIETLIQVLIANGEEKYITHAIKVEFKAADAAYRPGTTIVVELFRDQAESLLPPGKKFDTSKTTSSYRHMAATVEAVNKYSIDKQYTVRIGSTLIPSVNPSSRGITPVIDIEEATPEVQAIPTLKPE